MQRGDYPEKVLTRDEAPQWRRATVVQGEEVTEGRKG